MTKTVYLSGLKYIYWEQTRVSKLRESWCVYYSKELHAANNDIELTEGSLLSYFCLDLGLLNYIFVAQKLNILNVVSHKPSVRSVQSVIFYSPVSSPSLELSKPNQIFLQALNKRHAPNVKENSTVNK